MPHVEIQLIYLNNQHHIWAHVQTTVIVINISEHTIGLYAKEEEQIN